MRRDRLTFSALSLLVKKHVFLGASENACGLTCLRMLLADFAKDKNYVYYSPGREGGLSLEEIIRAGEAEGLVLKAYAAPRKEELREEKGPLILILNGKSGTHAVVYDRSFLGMASLRDPDSGRRYLRYGRLCDLWTGQFLAVEGTDPHPYSGVLPEKQRNDGRLPAALISLLLQGLFLLALHFVGTGGNFLYPVLALSGFALLQILLEAYLDRKLRRFDEEYLGGIDGNGGDLAANFRSYCAYKAAFYSRPLRLCGNVLAGGFLFALLLLNERSYIVPLLLQMLLLAADTLFLRPYVNRRAGALEALEARAFGENDGEKRRGLLSEVRDESAALGRLISLKRTLSTFLECALALLATALSATPSLNYFLFAVLGFHAIRLTLGSAFGDIADGPIHEARTAAFLRRYRQKGGEVK